MRIEAADLRGQVGNVAGADVRRIADQDIEGAFDALQRIARQPLGATGDAEALRILAGDIESGLADVGADAGGVRQLARSVSSRQPVPVPTSRMRNGLACRPSRSTISSAASISVSLSGRGSSVAGEIAKLRP